MPFQIPAFNLAVNIWRTPAMPPVGPPALVTVGNLTPGRRVTADWNVFGMTMQLLLPALTDIRAAPNSIPSDVVEVPAGTGRFYLVIAVDDMGKGFPNEYRMALILPKGIWVPPYP